MIILHYYYFNRQTHTHTQIKNINICILQQSDQSTDQEIMVLSTFFFFKEKEAMCIMDIRVNIFKYINHLWHGCKLK